MEGDLRAKVAYLKGLADGVGIEPGSKEGKVIMGILGVLEDMTDAFEAVWDNQDNLEEYLDSMDSDLAKLEDDYYEEDDDDEEFLELDCPRCGEMVCIDPDLIDEEESLELVCPGCGEIIDLDAFEEDFDDDTLGTERTDD